MCARGKNSGEIAAASIPCGGNAARPLRALPAREEEEDEEEEEKAARCGAVRCEAARRCEADLFQRASRMEIVHRTLQFAIFVYLFI